MVKPAWIGLLSVVAVVASLGAGVGIAAGPATQTAKPKVPPELQASPGLSFAFAGSKCQGTYIIELNPLQGSRCVNAIVFAGTFEIDHFAHPVSNQGATIVSRATLTGGVTFQVGNIDTSSNLCLPQPAPSDQTALLALKNNGATANGFMAIDGVLFQLPVQVFDGTTGVHGTISGPTEGLFGSLQEYSVAGSFDCQLQ